MLLPLALLTAAGQAAPVAPLISAETKAIVARRETIGSDEMVRQLEQRAATGDSSATELLGELFDRANDTGLPTDPAHACSYFERAAAVRGDSAHNLATCFFHGQGTASRSAPGAAIVSPGDDTGLADFRLCARQHDDRRQGWPA
jgi:hypothetical protein